MGETSYSREPRIGLSLARNTAVDRCLDLEADWIAFFDDDEMVDENWLVEMVAAINTFPDAKAFAGPVHRKISKNSSPLFPDFGKNIFKTGTRVLRASTGNILFHRSIYSENGANLRFDERFNLTGGEDTFLFRTMRKSGFPILWLQEASCVDEVSVDRSTLQSRFLRSVRDTHINGVIN